MLAFDKSKYGKIAIVCQGENRHIILYIGIQIKILGCVISRAISTTYKTYDLFDGAPSSLAKVII